VTDKAQAFETLLNELSAALADVVDTMKTGQDQGNEIAAALADIVGLLESRKPDTAIPDLIEAVKAIRITAPDVNVTVSPTPVTVTPVVQILERVKPGAYEMTFTYDRHDRLETARLVPLASVPEPKKPAMMFGGGE
jgi:hypothetical protein